MHVSTCWQCASQSSSASTNEEELRKGIEDAVKERDGGLVNPAYTTTTLGQANK